MFLFSAFSDPAYSNPIWPVVYLRLDFCVTSYAYVFTLSAVACIERLPGVSQGTFQEDLKHFTAYHLSLCEAHYLHQNCPSPYRAAMALCIPSLYSRDDDDVNDV